jgi:hypothetical protein
VWPRLAMPAAAWHRRETKLAAQVESAASMAGQPDPL